MFNQACYYFSVVTWQIKKSDLIITKKSRGGIFVTLPRVKNGLSKDYAQKKCEDQLCCDKNLLA